MRLTVSSDRCSCRSSDLTKSWSELLWECLKSLSPCRVEISTLAAGLALALPTRSAIYVGNQHAGGASRYDAHTCNVPEFHDDGRAIADQIYVCPCET